MLSISIRECVAQVAFLLGLSILFSNGVYAGEGTTTKQHLCNRSSPIDASSDGNLDRGDRLFRQQRYRLAAAAYYQVSFCGNNTILYPALSHQPAVVEGCKHALLLANDGHYREAADQLRILKQQLPRFTEAGYLAGDFFWAAADKKSAKQMWLQTIHGLEFALPEDQQDQAKLSAKQMLDWTKSHR